jgi:hypothetical protein
MQLAPICDHCENDSQLPRLVCVGYASDGIRTPITTLQGTHQHDLSKHLLKGLHQCIGCGCDELHACDNGCYWLAVNDESGLGVCSECPGVLPNFRYRTFEDSPDAGTPECICSLCQQVIALVDVPIRMNRFHHRCAKLIGIV